MTRLFVAALPTPAVRVALREIPRPDEPGVRWVPEANWHVTLRFLGDADADAVAQLLTGVRLPATTMRFGPRVERLGGNQIVVPVAGVDDLAHTVRTATVAIGEHDRLRFRGHLTIARTKREARSSAIGTQLSARCEVHTIALIRSELHHDGARYATVEEFAVEESAVEEFETE